MKVFNKNFWVSEGFCSSGQWFKLIKRNCFALIEEIYSSFFEDRFIFDFDENYSKLLAEFSHMSLFSICLQFLRCAQSFDKKSSDCRLCSRVRESFLNVMLFQNCMCVLWFVLRYEIIPLFGVRRFFN